MPRGFNGGSYCIIVAWLTNFVMPAKMSFSTGSPEHHILLPKKPRLHDDAWYYATDRVGLEHFTLVMLVLQHAKPAYEYHAAMYSRYPLHGNGYARHTRQSL
jgi:hypothetical protein